MCLDILYLKAELPKKVLAYKQFKIGYGREAISRKEILGGRHRPGWYVRGKLYRNTPVSFTLWDCSGYGNEYQPGYHAYAAMYEPGRSPSNVRLFLVELTHITAKGRQNNTNVYVAQRMKIIKQVKV